MLLTLAGGISMWLLAGLWHEIIMAQFYTAQTHATHEGTGIILLAYLILAALMAYLYPRIYTDGKSVLEGLKFGVVIGLLWVLPHELAMAGAHGELIVYVLKNAAWHMVEQGVGGMVIGFTYQKLLVG